MSDTRLFIMIIFILKINSLWRRPGWALPLIGLIPLEHVSCSGAQGRNQLQKMISPAFLEIKNHPACLGNGSYGGHHIIFKMDHLTDESSVIQLMVKNCLFEERIIAKEQRGQMRWFLSKPEGWPMGDGTDCV